MAANTAVRQGLAKKTRWGGAGVLAVAATLAFAVPAAAQTAGTPVTATQASAFDQAAAKPAICARLDKISGRGQKLLTRLNADANTRGSIAWLNAKAAAATSSGETELAALYTDRASRRTELVQTLTAIGPELQTVVQAHCQ